MKAETNKGIRGFVVELVLYALLVVGYFLLVLRYLSGWLYDLFCQERKGYAAAALVLIIGQGFVLEVLTRFLVEFVAPRRED